jgi:hypothetical protein
MAVQLCHTSIGVTPDGNIFGWYLCLEVTSFESTKSSQILTLAQSVGPFSADVNLKYELCISDNNRDISKRSPQMVVRLCCATIWCAPLLK